MKSFVISTLRRSSYRYWPRENARKKAKVGRNQYTCFGCKGIFGRKDTKLDHQIPVVDPIIGWVSYDSFIERLFCPEENFQVLCKSCHSIKSKEENLVRKLNKKKVVK